MPGHYLPVQYTQRLVLKHEPTGRETILLIPGAASMAISQLKEIIQWQQEKFEAEAQAAGPKPKRVYSRKEVGQALKEFRDAALKRQGRSRNRNLF